MNKVEYMKSVRFKAIGNPECAGYSNNWLKMHGIQKRAWKQLDIFGYKMMRITSLRSCINLMLDFYKSIQFYRDEMECDVCEHDFEFNQRMIDDYFDNLYGFYNELIDLKFTSQEIKYRLTCTMSREGYDAECITELCNYLELT